jgi:pentatricopeptide repeat protein
MEKKAIDLYNHIKNPDEVIVTILFNACAQLRNNDVLSLIKKTTKQIPKYYLKDQFLLASLFNALIKCGDCSSAHDVLSKMIKPVNSYGNLMNGFNKENSFEKTLNLFYQMKIDNC